jgi:hypothetical protein
VRYCTARQYFDNLTTKQARTESDESTCNEMMNIIFATSAGVILKKSESNNSSRVLKVGFANYQETERNGQLFTHRFK